jgi:cytoskeletal protein CcmA (bactofilin family)
MNRTIAWTKAGLLLLALTWPRPDCALAAVLRHSENFVLPQAETIHDDLYVAGRVVNIQGTVDGDLVVAGQTITVSGDVTGDVIAAGRDITISGSVGGTVRATGSAVSIDGSVAHDVVAGCGTFVSGPHATIGRDALVGAGTALFGGKVSRDARAGAGSATFSGSVGGTVYAYSKEVKLTDGAVLEHDLLYTSRNAVEKAPGATVRGRIEQRVPKAHERPGPMHHILHWVRMIIGLAILGALFYLLFSRLGQRSVDTLGKAPLASLGIGIVLAVVLPAAIASLFILGLMIGGWWVAIGLMALYLFAVAVGYVVAATGTGRWILARAGRGGTRIGWAMLLGLLTLGLLSAIPIVGKLVCFAAALCGLGAAGMAWFRTRRGETGPLTPASRSSA